MRKESWAVFFGILQALPACVAFQLCTAFWAKTFNPAIVKLFFVRGCVCELSMVLRAVVVISSVTKAERSQGHILKV